MAPKTLPTKAAEVQTFDIWRERENNDEFHAVVWKAGEDAEENGDEDDPKLTEWNQDAEGVVYVQRGWFKCESCPLAKGEVLNHTKLRADTLRRG